VSSTLDPADVGASPSATTPSVVEVSGGPGRASLDGLRELVAFHGVLTAFAIRDVRIKYKQAAIGIGWSVLQPLVAAGVFALFLGRLARVPSDGAPYFLMALSGLVVWTYFSSAVNAASESLVREQALLRKVFFPREILPLASILAAIVDLVPGLALLAMVCAAYGRAGLALLFLPLALLPLVVAGIALGLALSAVNVYYRDVRYALPFVLQIGLFATPVVYPLAIVPEEWRDPYAILNPVAGVIEAVRSIAIEDRLPDALLLLANLGWAAALAVGAYLFFKRLERGFSDRV